MWVSLGTASSSESNGNARYDVRTKYVPKCAHKVREGSFAIPSQYPEWPEPRKRLVMEEIPMELVAAVLGIIPFKDRVAARGVCHLWKGPIDRGIGQAPRFDILSTSVGCSAGMALEARPSGRTLGVSRGGPLPAVGGGQEAGDAATHRRRQLPPRQGRRHQGHQDPLLPTAPLPLPGDGQVYPKHPSGHKMAIPSVPLKSGRAREPGGPVQGARRPAAHLRRQRVHGALPRCRQEASSARHLSASRLPLRSRAACTGSTCTLRLTFRFALFEKGLQNRPMAVDERAEPEPGCPCSVRNSGARVRPYE